MPGLRRELDPDATATAPSAAKQTPPRRAPREKDGDPGAVPSPRAASRVSPSKKTPPRAPRLVQEKDGDPGEEAVPSPCDATPPPRALGQPAPTTSTLEQVTDGAPAPPPTHAPVAPRTGRRKLVPRIVAGPAEKTVKKPATYPCVAPPSRSRPCPAQARYATAPDSYAPVPFDWPIQYRGIFPRPYAPAPAAVFPGAMPSHQLPRSAAEVELARTQPQGSASAGFKRKGEVPVDSAKVKKRPLRSSDQSVKTSVERDILDSVTAFGRHNPLEMDIIRSALIAIPRGPELLLQCEKCPDGDHAARGATCIHTCSRDAIGHVGESSASAVKAFGFDVGPELNSINPDAWNRFWEHKPLILWDIDIVRAAQVRGTEVNVAQRITDILQNHSGPVSYFRIDSCQVDIANRDKLVEKWFDILRRKSIKEVVLVNCRWPDVFEFSITNLDCGSLERASLTFMNLTDIVLGHALNLVEINLCCCSLTPADLYALSYECRNLRVLCIGLHEADVIRINSRTLEVLKIWHCAVKKVAVQNALKLQRFLVASGANKPSIRILIEDAPLLSALSVNLSSQCVAMCNLKSRTDNAPLDSLIKLVIHISFKAEKERNKLLMLLESSKELKELILWRNDDIYQYEFLDAILDDWSTQLKDLYCLKFHLEIFSIQDCKGGDAELAVSSAVLEHSPYLKQLILKGDIFKDPAMVIHAKAKLEKATHSSKSAIVTIKAELSASHKKIASFLEEV